MKLSTKPISSPGRTDKFPPPLMRFLRNNAASRSRGRSRSKTIFLRKKNTTIETQEPSSPKVTCMGQVRVKRSTKQPSTKRVHSAGGDGAPTKCRCRWCKSEPARTAQKLDPEVNDFWKKTKLGLADSFFTRAL
ncbi:hypothetical protein RJT34_24421 [Clitoria ternatea]|uniref:Uncharacterized protein n=1 Tax=Clitoria ternatea TaxID=43366 RepID=A0AAN9IL89_CLITE